MFFKFYTFLGSYDHFVKMYDARTGSCVMSVDHGVPVESVLMFQSGGLFISAGWFLNSYSYIVLFYKCIYMHTYLNIPYFYLNALKKFLHK